MARKKRELFPGMRLSPDGKEFRLFDREEDVPAGWLRETPESFAKKGLGKSPIRPVSDEHVHAPADYEEPKKRGRPKKEVSDGEIDL